MGSVIEFDRGNGAPADRIARSMVGKAHAKLTGECLV